MRPDNRSFPTYRLSPELFLGQFEAVVSPTGRSVGSVVSTAVSVGEGRLIITHSHLSLFQYWPVSGPSLGMWLHH